MRSSAPDCEQFEEAIRLLEGGESHCESHCGILENRWHFLKRFKRSGSEPQMRVIWLTQCCFSVWTPSSQRAVAQFYGL